MRKPTSGEVKALSTFFRDAAPQYGLYDWKAKTLRPDAPENGLFAKNLLLLRELVDKGIETKRIEQHCRFCRKEKRQVQWINEVIPSEITDSECLARNILGLETHVHPLLVKVTTPTTRLEFGGGPSSASGDFSIETATEFTMKNLVDYFFTTFGLRDTKETQKAAAGAFNYLLHTYSIDAILYAIDFAHQQSKVILGPLQLSDQFLPEAEEYLSNIRSRGGELWQ